MTTLGTKVVLGRTGLEVSRLGIGSAYGVSPRACLRAFDAGVNYFFWGSVRTAGMGVALRDLAKTHRDELVIVLESYARGGWTLRRSVMTGLKKLGVDYADILLLGWHDAEPPAKVFEVAKQLQEEGRFRFLAISSHKRLLFPRFLEMGDFDVFHIRYSAAHPGAESDVFPHLQNSGGPGIVAFNATRWGQLLPAKNMPDGMTPPTAAECYRFTLSDPHVHVAITGPKNDEEMAHALTILASAPMDAEEMARMREIGAHVHDIRTFMSAMT